MGFQKVWKVVKVHNKKLISCIASGEIEVMYSTTEFVGAHKELTKVGANLLAFDTYDNAHKFHKNESSIHTKIYEAIATGIVPATASGISRIIVPSSSASRYLQQLEDWKSSSLSFPVGTLFAKKVKLLKDVTPCSTSQ